MPQSVCLSPSPSPSLSFSLSFSSSQPPHHAPLHLSLHFSLPYLITILQDPFMCHMLLRMVWQLRRAQTSYMEPWCSTKSDAGPELALVQTTSQPRFKWRTRTHYSVRGVSGHFKLSSICHSQHSNINRNCLPTWLNLPNGDDSKEVCFFSKL